MGITRLVSGARHTRAIAVMMRDCRVFVLRILTPCLELKVNKRRVLAGFEGEDTQEKEHQSHGV